MVATHPVQEGTIPFKGYETWYRIVGGGEEPERYMEVLDDFLTRVEARVQGCRVSGDGRTPAPEE